MTCQLSNQTPLPAIVKPHRDHHGRLTVLVIAKGTWQLSSGRMASAEQQVSLFEKQTIKRLGDLLLDPIQKKVLEARQNEEVVWLDHDLSPPKPLFDVIVAGYATAPPNWQQAHIDAGILIGKHAASLRAQTPRCWQPGVLGDHPKALAKTVARVPLTYAVADWSEGFPITSKMDELAWLPWIEVPGVTAQRNKHGHSPAGFGVWAENALHRLPYAGTYDDDWKRERAPNLPKDFDPRFYNIAHPDLQLAKAPTGGTAIRLVHLAEQPVIDVSFPHMHLMSEATTAAGRTQTPVALRPDTLIIEPDHDRLSVVWRTLLPDDISGAALRTVRLFKDNSHSQPA